MCVCVCVCDRKHVSTSKPQTEQPRYVPRLSQVLMVWHLDPVSVCVGVSHVSQFIDEADRSLHDAIMIVRRALKHAEVVPGGGAIEMEVRLVIT